MLITIGQLEEWAASKDICKWFVARFPSGGAEYHKVLDALSEEDESYYANYLMDCAGPDYSIVRQFNAPYSGKTLFCAGRIVSNSENLS